MQDNKLDNLIKQLESFNLRQRAAIIDLKSERRRQKSQANKRSSATRSTTSRNSPRAPTQVSDFQVGNQIYIVNNPKPPPGKKPSPEDRTGNVFKITAKKVQIRTDS